MIVSFRQIMAPGFKDAFRELRRAERVGSAASCFSAHWRAVELACLHHTVHDEDACSLKESVENMLI